MRKRVPNTWFSHPRLTFFVLRNATKKVTKKMRPQQVEVYLLRLNQFKVGYRIKPAVKKIFDFQFIIDIEIYNCNL
jgi:hypothetical protein